MNKKITRTYRLDASTVERIERLCNELQAFPSPLIDMILQRALDEVEAGRWAFGQVPVKFKIKWR
ncbi:MAG: hypothetical protein KDE50_25095 [Caldilineaceae bacterium]|nr:hypothetical protein [Caldilineaceae bacterium]